MNSIENNKLPYLVCKNFSKTINKTLILDNISFSMEKGEVLVILGKSGAGKTTLVRNLNFLDFPDTGTLELDGEMVYNADEKSVSSQELQRRHKLMGLVFQSFNLFPHYSVIENTIIASKLENKNIAKVYRKTNNRKLAKDYLMKLNNDSLEKAKELLKYLGLENKINSYPCELSGGESQRVAIARALMANPKVLCFDEPTSALDPALTYEVVKLIKKLKEQNQTMIIITHELDFACQVADRIIEIKDGKIVRNSYEK